ncbi:MAG: amidophosphoribosyltransferase, partial [Candidatus Sericytochromatia bacterium]|nr:amidophosphoribosyltransferase [Candidatus Sericytochromatia bacterium]
MCGVLGLLDPTGAVVEDLARGALALQHRGQDGAGLVTYADRFYHRTGLGLWSEVFRHESLTAFRGQLGLAHLRYGTSGTGDSEECQPFLLSYPFGLALVHNGNLTNDAMLRQRLDASGHRLVNSASDSETLLQVFAQALARQDLTNMTPAAILDAVDATMAKLEGAYAVVILIAHHGLLAFRDPHGIRPLVVGMRDRAVAFASESVALDAMDVELVRDVAPGEAIFVDLSGRVHTRQLRQAPLAHCAFEYVYLARPESIIDGESVAGAREALGEALARRFEVRSTHDVVFDVPSSAEDTAVAFARAIELPYRKGIRKKQYAHRSFIAANRTLRQHVVGMKFLLEKRAIAGQRVIVVDDSIVRGTTARVLMGRLRQQGATKLAFLSAAPRITHPCVCG